MTICHVVNHFHPRIGGVERSVAALGEAMVRQGHAVTVLTEGDGRSPAEEQYRGMTLRRFQVKRVWPITRLAYRTWVWRHRAMLDAFDVLHFHDHGVFNNWFTPLHTVLRHPVFAMTFHGFDGWPIKRRHVVMRRHAAQSMDVTFAVGDYLRRYYTERHDEVFLGAPMLTAPPGRTDARHRQPTLLYAGRLEPDTGIDTLVRCVAAASRDVGIPMTCVLAGDGSLADAIRRHADAWCTLEMRGWLPDPTPLLAGADLFAGTGFLSILDAMAAGVPLVVPTLTAVKRDYVASIPDIAHRAVCVTDEASMTAFFRFWLLGDLKETLADNARNAATFAASLTWDAIATTHLHRYALCMDTRR